MPFVLRLLSFFQAKREKHAPSYRRRVLKTGGFPHLAFPPELAPCSAGCRGFIGPVPPPLWIRQYSLCGSYYSRGQGACQGQMGRSVKKPGRRSRGPGGGQGVYGSPLRCGRNRTAHSRMATTAHSSPRARKTPAPWVRALRRKGSTAHPSPISAASIMTRPGSVWGLGFLCRMTSLYPTMPHIRQSRSISPTPFHTMLSSRKQMAAARVRRILFIVFIFIWKY